MGCRLGQDSQFGIKKHGVLSLIDRSNRETNINYPTCLNLGIIIVFVVCTNLH